MYLFDDENRFQNPRISAGNSALPKKVRQSEKIMNFSY